MRAMLFGAGLAVAGAVAAGTLGIQPGNAGEEYKPKAMATALLEEPLAGTKGKKVIIKHFAFPPGFVGGRHIHPGPVYVYVLEGSLTVAVKGRKTQTVTAGKLYKEPLNRVMQARNLSTKDWAKIIVFQIGDEGKPMMIKAE